MNTQKSIPIVVGITGHRNLREQDPDTLLRAVLRELSDLIAHCPHSQVVMLNSLAEGADQLCAGAAEALSIPLIAALPMVQNEYEHDFSGEPLRLLQHYCRAAADCFVVPAAELSPVSPKKSYYYRQASIYVASHCHILFALWDGSSSSASSCGTAEAVRIAREGAFRSTEDVSRFGTGAVLRFNTPRSGSDATAPVGETCFLGDRAPFDEILTRIDALNRSSM